MFDLFSDELCGVKDEQEKETNLNSMTNSNQSMFDNECFKQKLTEATDKVRAEFKEEIESLKSKILEYEQQMSTEKDKEVDNTEE